ncbi:MAG: LPS export ABC transporter permease LptG, partial [Pseudomonadota bacterium]
RYLVTTMLGATGLVLMVLLGLAAFVNFAGQLDNVGEGSYTIVDALIYVVLIIPQQAYEMLPVASLIGALLGLGALASNSEMTVLRASGVSIWRLARSVAIGGLALTVLAGALGELIAPPAEQYAKRYRAQQLNRDVDFSGGQGGWIKDGNVIVNGGAAFSGDPDSGVRIYRFNDDGRLLSVGRAAMAEVSEHQTWLLTDYGESSFSPAGVATRNEPLATQRSLLSPELVRLSIVEPDQLSGRRLARYVDYLRSNGLSSDRYEIARWSRIASVVTVFLMSLLALPFVFGSLRSSGAGTRLVIGVLFGVAYYLVSQTLANSGTVYGLNPVLTAFSPPLLLSLIIAFLMSRVR